MANAPIIINGFRASDAIGFSLNALYTNSPNAPITLLIGAPFADPASTGYATELFYGVVLNANCFASTPKRTPIRKSTQTMAARSIEEIEEDEGNVQASTRSVATTEKALTQKQEEQFSYATSLWRRTANFMFSFWPSFESSTHSASTLPSEFQGNPKTEQKREQMLRTRNREMQIREIQKASTQKTLHVENNEKAALQLLHCQAQLNKLKENVEAAIPEVLAKLKSDVDALAADQQGLAKTKIPSVSQSKDAFFAMSSLPALPQEINATAVMLKQ